jgi:hypothetical protein
MHQEWGGIETQVASTQMQQMNHLLERAERRAARFSGAAYRRATSPVRATTGASVPIESYRQTYLETTITRLFRNYEISAPRRCRVALPSPLLLLRHCRRRPLLCGLLLPEPRAARHAARAGIGLAPPGMELQKAPHAAADVAAARDARGAAGAVAQQTLRVAARGPERAAATGDPTATAAGGSGWHAAGAGVLEDPHVERYARGSGADDGGRGLDIT